MSTFNGIVEEFPHIRIDYFRKNPSRPSPLACFLSHVHSDHLQGLESLRAPFIYCSVATREILLRMEKYPHRINFSKGILESRKQHYKHLAKLLRPIPLHVPTEIELMPGNRIRVTLFDANHCPGAVMFLIEGNGKAILYTGDIRAERWWVDSLVRNPTLIQYTLGARRLERVYLDTTFATKSNIYATFPSKAEGINELIEKVQKYPDDTIFYFRNWTFGYEEVWLALSTLLNSQVHVDRYQLGLFKSLASSTHIGFGSTEGLYLCGFPLGNSSVQGCLSDDKSARVHSCEPGDVCSTVSSRRSVYITPVITRMSDGSEVQEIGAGGGLGDLHQTHDLVLEDEFSAQQLIALCAEQTPDADTRERIVRALSDAHASKKKSLSLDDYGGVKEEDEISLKRLIQILSQGTETSSTFSGCGETCEKNDDIKPNDPLPNSIRFPYSRHSSYEELRMLVGAFRPKDIYPCTVDFKTWTEVISMEHLFGDLCSGTNFSHDNFMREMLQQVDFPPQKRQRRDNDHTEAVSPQHPDTEIAVHQTTDASSDSSVQITRASIKEAEPHRAPNEMNPSQVSLSLSESPGHLCSSEPDLGAIKRALKQKAENDEIEFYLSSSFEESQLSLRSVGSGTCNENQLIQEPTNTSSPTPIPTTPRACEEDAESDAESSVSLSPSAFDSQPATVTTDTNSNDKDLDSVSAPPESNMKALKSRRSRMEAYRAAKSGDSEVWSSLYSPITAGNNHTQVEVEL